MQLQITGTNIDVGDALRTHVSERLSGEIEKYFSNAIESSVSFSRDAYRFRSHISIHIGRGMLLQGEADASSAHFAFDGALTRIGKQLRRYKRRLRDHNRGPAAADGEPAVGRQYVLANDAGVPDSGAAEETDAPGEPAIIAEMEAHIATLTVSEAVMRLDLGDLPVLMFKNSAHGGINVIYRRRDGNVGWIDPEIQIASG